MSVEKLHTYPLLFTQVFHKYQHNVLLIMNRLQNLNLEM